MIVGTVRSIRERKKRAEKSKQSAKMLSFKSGMIALPEEIAKFFDDKIILSAEVTSIDKTNDGYIVSYKHNGIDEAIAYDAVLSTVPAYMTSEFFTKFNKNFKTLAEAIYYSPVLVYFLAYNKKDVKQPLDGFGFLIPEKENKSFLGALWSSVIFPYRAQDNYATFTLFIGGSRNPNFIKEDREILLSRVRKEFEEIMKITGQQPVYSFPRFWEKAIPQYNIGYIEHEKFFDEFEKKSRFIYWRKFPWKNICGRLY